MTASDTAAKPPTLADLGCRFVQQPGAAAIERAQVDAAQWRGAAATVAANGGRLVALWGTDRRGAGEGHAVAAAYALGATLYWLDLPLAAEAGGAAGAGGLEHAGTTEASPGADAVAGPPPTYPDLGATFACARRMQRAIADLNGLQALAAPQDGADAALIDRRPWLRHAAWPPDYFPLRHDAGGGDGNDAFIGRTRDDALDSGARHVAADERYPFVVVEGDGVHEIAVGAFTVSKCEGDDQLDPLYFRALPEPSTAMQKLDDTHETPFMPVVPSMSEGVDQPVPVNTVA